MKKNLIILYIILVVVKIASSLLITSPSFFGDEYSYAKTARSMFYEGKSAIHGEPTNQFPPLYPAILSFAYIGDYMPTVYLLMKIINAILSTLIIIPAYLILIEFFEKKKAFLGTVIIGVLPPTFVFSGVIMAENIYYPLMLLTFYFVYKSFQEKSYKWDVFAGISMGAALLTKAIGAFFLPAVGALALYKVYKKDIKQIPKKIVFAAVTTVLVLPWLIRNAGINGTTTSAISGYHGIYKYAFTSQTTMAMFTWIGLYAGFILLSTGVIFAAGNLLARKEVYKDQKTKDFYILTIFAIVSIIVLASNLNLDTIMFKTLLPWLTDRPIGRYIDVVMPLVIIGGLIGLKNKTEDKKRWKIVTAVILALTILSSQLMFFPIFPINNISLSLLGATRYLLEVLLLGKTSPQTGFTLLPALITGAVALLFSIVVLKTIKRLSQKRIMHAAIAFFMIVNILAVSMIAVNAKNYWGKSEQMQLGKFLENKERGKVTVLIDKNAEGKITKTEQDNLYFGWSGRSFTIVGFWLNQDIVIEDPDENTDAKYMITTRDLPFEKIKETSNGIKLYERKAQ